jgi:3-oxoacyl-[acyl-carrier-protein] synthase II
MNIYINGTAVISAQNHLDPGPFPETVYVPTGLDHFTAQEPSYKEHISPNMIRRMGRAIKMGVSTSLRCLEDAGIKEVDGVVCGTGIGCFEDSEKFLLAIIENKESLLTPTAFIQSTHNTVGAQIALLIKCHNYNMTYVQRGFSFETAILDSMLLLEEGAGRNILTGGIDEMTPGYLTLQRNAGYIKADTYQGSDLAEEKTAGHYMGEGAAFFVLSSAQSGASYALLSGVELIYKPASTDILFSAITSFLKIHQLIPSDLSLALIGNSGDARYEQKTVALQNELFADVPQGNFKHLCGEYMTNGSFALWLAARILKTGKIPLQVYTREKRAETFNRILIINHYRDQDYSLMLVSKC